MSTDWIPFELMNADARSMVRWVHPGDGPLFQEPFFQQSAQALVDAHAVQKLTPLAALADVAPLKAPAGFIFHVSRCGSTLVSRSLAALPRHRVISEPGPLNQLLLDDAIDPQRKAALLKGLIHALCGTAPGTDCIIKFSSWNLLFIAQILALFPDTPWVFIHRAPVDVLQSLTAEPPGWAGNEALARALRHRAGGDEFHFALTLERLYAAALPHAGPLGMAVDYARLPGAVADIAAHFGLVLGADGHARMAQMGAYDAKQAGLVAFHARARLPVSAEMGELLVPLDALQSRWLARAAGPAEAGAPDVDGAGVLPSRASIARKMDAYAAHDRHVLAQIASGQLRLPANTLLADIHRRRGDLGAAAVEYDRLHALGNAAPELPQFRAIFHHARAPARLPEQAFAPAPFVIIGDFLSRADNQALLADTVARRAAFHPTELQNADAYGEQQRTNLVSYELGAFGAALRALVMAQLPLLCARLNLAPIDVTHIQLKLASYADGDFFRAHQDNGLTHTDRVISFVYYFHREPKPYSGGDLLLYDSRFAPRAYVRSLFTRYVPQNNGAIFFPSEYFHEVEPVVTARDDFAASRFTLAGHVCGAPASAG
jgi:Rps23 Pro-64 3,4-dihydroxylase Tpa1-like proline 4-hydroxylase